MNDENLGKSEIEFEFSEEGHKMHEKFFDEKSCECESLCSEKKSHLVASASESRDMVLRLCPILQIIEMAIDFLTQNTTFEQSNIETFDQPLLPNAAIIKPESVT